MQTKKFLIQLECADNTRFHASDAELCEWLHLPIQSAINAQTAGPCPRVTITAEEQPAPSGADIPIHFFTDKKGAEFTVTVN